MHRISSWRCIDHLAMHYKQLHNIRVTHVPLFVGKGVSEVRPLVIGRIQQLKFFNGSGVSARERVDGEKAYLRKIKREILEFKPETHSYNEHVGEDNCKEARIPSAILENHPRYKELDDRYGEELLPMGDPTRNNATISEDLVQLTFNNLCFGGNATNEPIVRKLPSNINIKSLKQLCKSIFNLDLTIDVLSISLRCYQDRDVPPTLLDDDSNSLHYYGVGIEGGDIYINELKH